MHIPRLNSIGETCETLECQWTFAKLLIEIRGKGPVVVLGFLAYELGVSRRDIIRAGRVSAVFQSVGIHMTK